MYFVCWNDESSGPHLLLAVAKGQAYMISMARHDTRVYVLRDCVDNQSTEAVFLNGHEVIDE